MTQLKKGITSAEIPHALKNFSVVFNQVVAWGELDALNHLNNAVYYRYMESARIEYLRKIGMFEEGQILVVAKSSCTYLRPVFFPDVLQIGVRTQKLGNTSMVIECAFYSTEQQEVVAISDTIIVQLDETSNKLPWTDIQRQNLLAIEAEVSHIPKT